MSINTPRCHFCRYELRGIASSRCPECGNALVFDANSLLPWDRVPFQGYKVFQFFHTLLVILHPRRLSNRLLILKELPLQHVRYIYMGALIIVIVAHVGTPLLASFIEALISGKSPVRASRIAVKTWYAVWFHYPDIWTIILDIIMLTYLTIANTGAVFLVVYLTDRSRAVISVLGALLALPIIALFCIERIVVCLLLIGPRVCLEYVSEIGYAFLVCNWIYMVLAVSAAYPKRRKLVGVSILGIAIGYELLSRTLVKVIY